MPSTPIIKARFLAIDMEMTGLDPTKDEIIEVAAIPFNGLKIGDEPAFYSEIQPERNIPSESKAIHGLHGKELSNAPHLEEVLPQLLEMFYNRILVAHGPDADLEFIRVKARIAGVAMHERPTIDTSSLAAVVFPNWEKRPSLDELLARFELRRPKGKHNALTDALLTARVFMKMLAGLRASDRVRTVSDLLRIGGK